MTKRYTATIEEGENGEGILPLPDEVLLELGVKEGDELLWTDNKDGSYTLTKKPEGNTWVLVETVQMFRHRYMVEVPAGKEEYALDTVTMQQAKEFSQLYLDETITSHRVLSEEAALDLCDADNDYIKNWSKEKKLAVFFTHEHDEILNDK